VHTALPARYLGTQLDRRYRLDRLIGEGASAWVFAAQDLRLERDVAIKLLKPLAADEQVASRRRFVAEGRTLARLVHPHIVLVHDAGETEDGLGYLVMELSDAGNLEAELFERGTLSAEECVRLLLPLMGALACAHDRGIVHRDLKPANIVLLREHAETRAKLLDFGIARRGDAGCSTDSARGTPSYMAPEQARGDRLSPAIDVWALGVVFFRCLSGRLPFQSGSSLGTVLKLVGERAPLFSTACPGLGARLAVALDRALEPDAERRHPDMRSFAYAVAVACAQDGIKLPREPDPLGLPDFGRWLAAADVETTRPLPEHERAQAAVASASAPSAIPRHWRPGLAVALFVGLCNLGAWLAGAPREERVSVEARPATTSAERAEVPPVVSAAPSDPVSTVREQPAAAQPPSGPLTAAQAPLAVPAVKKRRAPRAADSALGVAPSGPADRTLVDQLGMVTTWDW
jgi:serine/threonine protein kinase